MEPTVLSQVLARLLLLALHLLPVGETTFSLHVLEDGVYAGSYRVERSDREHAVFRAPAENSKLPAFEAERSRRRGQSYTVFSPKAGESFAVDLTEELKALKPFSSNRHQSLGGEKGGVRIDSEGRVLFLGSEEEKIVVVAEVSVSK